MTVNDLLNIVKFNSDVKNTDYAQKNTSRDNHDAFSSVFESANKNYNFSFEKAGKFSYKDLNKTVVTKEAIAKEATRKDFKSEYEDFNNKIETERNIDSPKKDDSEIKTGKSENHSEKEAVKNKSEEVSGNRENTEVAQASNEQKDINSENSPAEENISETNSNNKADIEPESKENPEIINNCAITEIINSNTLNIPLQIKNNAVELKDNFLTKQLAEELTAVQNRPANEKILNKQAESALQQQSVSEEASENQPELSVSAKMPEINPEELSETEKQVQSKKPEVLVTNNVLNSLNAGDKNQIKPAPSEKSAEILNNEDAKPVITNIEVENNSSKTGSEGQKQTQQDLKQGINRLPSSSLTFEENSLQKIDNQKTAQFDKILNSKQIQKNEGSILNQVNEKISSDITTGKSQVTIALRPDNLGKVNINLVSQNGVLTAQITAENSQVKDILNKGLETLRQSMSEQGISVGKMVVNVQEPASSNQNTNSEHNPKNFEQQASNSSNMNFQSGKQNFSQEGTSAYSENQSYEFDEEPEIETSEMNTSTGHSPAVHAGKVDYKV